MHKSESSTSIYYVIFGILLALTFATVGASYLPIGRWHTVMALTIAGIKATLVVLFFMHVRQSSRVIWLVLGASLLWLSILLGLTMTDYVSRGWMAGP